MKEMHDIHHPYYSAPASPEIQEIPDIDVEESSGLVNAVRSGMNKLRYGAEGVVVLAETTPIPPINEMIRFGAMGWAINKGFDPLVVAGVTGVATVGIEAPAAVAAADLISSPSVGKFTDRMNGLLEVMGVSRNAKLNGFLKAGAAYIGGSAVVTWLRHREDTDRTRSENMRYGLRSAVALAGTSAVQGYLIGKGFETPNAITISGGLGAIGIGVAAVKYFRNKLAKASTLPSLEGVDG